MTKPQIQCGVLLGTHLSHYRRFGKFDGVRGTIVALRHCCLGIDIIKLSNQFPAWVDFPPVSTLNACKSPALGCLAMPLNSHWNKPFIFSVARDSIAIRASFAYNNKFSRSAKYFIRCRFVRKVHVYALLRTRRPSLLYHGLFVSTVPLQIGVREFVDIERCMAYPKVYTGITRNIGLTVEAVVLYSLKP